MEDGGGHQMAHIEYPGLPTDYVMEMVHRFYDEYYFRPKAAFRVVWKAIVNRDVPRLYVEAKAFMKLRAQRNWLQIRIQDFPRLTNCCARWPLRAADSMVEGQPVAVQSPAR
jgi:hypothetical protein